MSGSSKIKTKAENQAGQELDVKAEYSPPGPVSWPALAELYPALRA
jgi:hypothetical protein